MEGIWEGPLPPISGSKSCSIRMLDSGLFDFSCEGAVRREGAGTYRFRDPDLTLAIEKMTEDGRVVKLDVIPFESTVSGPGNEIRLAPKDGGGVVSWTRKRL
jgi:hypothetical protein